MNDRLNSFLRIGRPIFLWMLFIVTLSSVPGPDIPELPIPFFHKGVHFFEYSVLGVLGLRAFLHGRPGVKFLKPSLLAWILSAIFALSDEWHQTFVPGRSGCMADVYFDMVCAALGIALYAHFRIQSSRKNS